MSNKNSNYKTDFGVEKLTVEEILMRFYNQFNYNRIPCNDQAKQNKDIDCYINDKKIQEKSGTFYNETNSRLLIEVYNNILAKDPKYGLYGWGVITEADFHVYGYRGTHDKKSIDWNNVYVAIYESKYIKDMGIAAIETPEFNKIVNDFKKDIIMGNVALKDKKCVLKNNAIVYVKCNSSEIRGGGIKYAITINVLTKDLGGKQSLYKLCNGRYKKLKG